MISVVRIPGFKSTRFGSRIRFRIRFPVPVTWKKISRIQFFRAGPDTGPVPGSGSEKFFFPNPVPLSGSGYGSKNFFFRVWLSPFLYWTRRVSDLDSGESGYRFYWTGTGHGSGSRIRVQKFFSPNPVLLSGSWYGSGSRVRFQKFFFPNPVLPGRARLRIQDLDPTRDSDNAGFDHFFISGWYKKNFSFQ